jgi:hypothetical protein
MKIWYGQLYINGELRTVAVRARSINKAFNVLLSNNIHASIGNIKSFERKDDDGKILKLLGNESFWVKK